MYNIGFKIARQRQLHFAKQPKSQHGVKATSFPRTFDVPPPLPAADTIFNGSERFTRTPIGKTRPMIGRYKSRPFVKIFWNKTFTFKRSAMTQANSHANKGLI